MRSAVDDLHRGHPLPRVRRVSVELGRQEEVNAHRCESPPYLVAVPQEEPGSPIFSVRADCWDLRLDEEPGDAVGSPMRDLVACPDQIGAADPGDDAAGFLHDRIERDDPDPPAPRRIAAGAVVAVPNAVPVP